MKRFLRLCACLLTAAILCVALCGCDALDEARANHGFWTESGSIRLGETEYLLLPYCAELQPMQTQWRTVSVTEPDVPVLVSDLFGQSFLKSDDGLFLEDGRVYCRADRHEEIRRRIENGVELTGYCYLYDAYDPKEDEFFEKYYTLTAQQVAAVNQVLTTVEPTPLPPSSELYYDEAVFLERCSEDLLFRRMDLDLYYVDNTYCLIAGLDYNGEYYGAEDAQIYQVPEAQYAVFAEIMAPAVEANAYWDEKYSYY